MFDFTAEELRLNQSGQLGPRQKARLKATGRGLRKGSKSGVWIILAFMLLGLGIIGALVLTSLDRQKLSVLGPQLLAGLCFTVLAVAVIIVISWLVARSQAAKLETAQVLTAEGLIRHDTGSVGESSFTSYHVYIGKKRFSFVDEMSRVFPAGAKFRVYYCKAGQIELILSFERLA